MPTLSPPLIGQPWPAQGGVYAGLVRGLNGGPDQHVILAAALPSKRLNWTAAKKWAATVQDEGHADFSLPTRDESALLYTNLRDQIEVGWYWTGTQYSAGHAWSQDFINGGQDYSVKEYEARARAVRRFAAESFNPSAQVSA